MNETVKTAKQVKNTICFVDTQGYALLDVQSGIITRLISIHENIPLILPVMEKEFFISIPGNERHALGLFIDTHSGNATRGTVEWSDYPYSLAYHFPFIVSLHKSVIRVYHVLLQKIVQNIQVNDHGMIANVFGFRCMHFINQEMLMGNIFFITQKSLSVLHMVNNSFIIETNGKTNTRNDFIKTNRTSITSCGIRQ